MRIRSALASPLIFVAILLAVTALVFLAIEVYEVGGAIDWWPVIAFAVASVVLLLIARSRRP
jgi:hypothetical protein